MSFTVGNTVTPSQTYGSYGLNASNNMAIRVTMPNDGVITSMSAYFDATHGAANCSAALCIWDDSTGALLASTPNFTITPGSGGLGGQAFHTANLTTPFAAKGGTVYKIGWWRQASGSDEWTEQNGGTEYQQTTAGSTSPGNVATWNAVSGSPSIFATFFIGGRINTGTPASPVWTPCAVLSGSGTPASDALCNTGTPASPVWTESA